MLVYKSEVGVIKGTGTRSPGSPLFLIYPLLRFIASNKEGRAFSGAEGFLNMDITPFSIEEMKFGTSSEL